MVFLLMAPPHSVKSISFVVFNILFAALAQTSRAQETTDALLTESEFLNELPVVLTATRLQQPKKNSPVASTIIDREMIAASGFTEIADLLRLAPGMLVNYDSGHIANAGYGFLFDRYRVRLQVIIDGMSVYTPLFGEMPWSQLGITIDDIERIEVIRGPSSASYGPNAMTGVISIITRHAALGAGTRLRLNQGANGRSEQFISYGNHHEELDYKLSLGARKDNGFKQRYDDKDLSIVNFRSDYQLSNHDVVNLSIQHNAGEYQEDSTPTLNDSMPEHLKDVTQTSWQGKLIHSFSDGDILSLNYYQQNYDDKNSYIGDFTADGYGFIFINESVSTHRKNLEINYSLYTDAMQLTLGTLYRKDNTKAPQYLYNSNINIDTRQLFINTAFHINEANILSVNLLHDDNDTGGSTLSPRVALNHQLSKHHSARISYSESSRSPFALEEYANRVVYIPLLASDFTVWTDLGDLKPEQIKSWDIGYIGNYNNNATEIDLRIYRNWLTDVIVQDWDLGGGFLQGDAFNMTGFEASLTHRFNHSRVILNYARIKIAADELIYGNPIWYESGAPDNSGSLLLMHDFSNRIKGSAGYYYTGSYQQLCCEADVQEPRKRLDLSLSRSFKIGKYNSSLTLVVQNLSNEKIATRLFNNYDRQGYLSFSMEL